MSDLPPLYPIVDLSKPKLVDGLAISACGFCQKSFPGEACQAHYARLKHLPEGFHECPYGFTSRTFDYMGSRFAITGVVAHPRFGSDRERAMAKKHPSVKVARQAVDSVVTFYRSMQDVRGQHIEDAAKVLPLALHELRKLNGAILHTAEKENRESPSPVLETIKSTAELMRNSFNVLEVIANPDLIRSVPMNDTVNVFDIFYKAKKIYELKARGRGCNIEVYGVRAIVNGSQKMFPIVPTVLIENAIKYCRASSTIKVTVTAQLGRALIDVENDSEHSVDPVGCFEKGFRGAAETVEGGGFGLYLAREVISAHGGTIACHPNATGVCFTVDLPLNTVIDFPTG